MCGIVGYIGKEQAAPILLEGLEKLEYRGYDSAGLAICNGEKINVRKAKGRLKVLYDMVEGGAALTGTVGLGHTRWATHGRPSDTNSHPQTSADGRFAVVHNGIIENYLPLKDMLMKKGYTFVSETDTEVVAHLINDLYSGDLLDTIIQVIRKIEGSYALGVLNIEQPDELVAVRKDSPLIVGASGQGNFIASDIPAVLKHTRDVYIMEDNELVILTRDGIAFFNMDFVPLEKKPIHIDWDISAAEKGGYDHFMMKEIQEQPKALRDTLGCYIRGDNTNEPIRLNTETINIPAEEAASIRNISIVACGSAYHAGVVAKYYMESFLKVPIDIDVASEFRYRDPYIDEHTLVVVVSQSGETADTLAAMRESKKRGAKTVAIVNVVGSSIAREADYVFYTWAGPEIAVATTKAYSAQLIVLYCLGLYLGQIWGKISDETLTAALCTLKHLPEAVGSILQNTEPLKILASRFSQCRNVFFIGRHIDHAVSLEASLKLKEISYIHSEAVAAGELKHGTISLIEEGTLVIALVTRRALYDKIVSNITEVKARGATVFAVTFAGNTAIEKSVDHVFYIPEFAQEFAASLSVVPLQIFAYYVAAACGCDIDKPRNLAKSVTVE